jgi:alpha-tubulin suppressor-like RCC1 family protein
MKNIIFIFLILYKSQIFSQCFVNLKSGANFVTGIKTDGTIWGWGDNGNNQLSLVSTNFPPHEQFPVQMGTNNQWVYNKNGRGNSFAIQSNGTLWACGRNNGGILGIGSTVISVNTFTQVGTATNYTAVDGYDSHTIALRSNGTLWAWGKNDFNQLGQGSAGADVLSPIQVGIATDWAKIAANGTDGSYAIKNNGTLWCWGFNCAGNMAGSTTITSRPSPFQIGTATNWLFVEPGNCHVLALKTDNTLWAWGNRSSGQLGIPGLTALQAQTPRQVGTATWQSIAAGEDSSFGVQTNGTLWVWGENALGELGLNDTTNRTIPTQLGTDTNWVSVIAGEDHTIAIKTDGTLWGWGRNQRGAAGNGTYNSATTYFTPVLVPTLIPNMCAPLTNESFSLATKINVYPNPAKEVVNITFSNTLQNPNISIVDVTGKTVFTQNYNEILNNTTINIANLTKGLYLIVVKSEGNISSQKLVVE